MKQEKNILVAFLLNLFFSIAEVVGGLLTGSVAILSDALHDLGDAASIGLAYFLERKSKQPPDRVYTYGYGRYSVVSGVITSGILLAGSVLVIVHAAGRLWSPVAVRSGGMLLMAVVGVAVNACAAFFTRHGDSLNQRSVNLHMLEDMLGWIVVLIGSVIIHFTGAYWIDPVMSIGVALFILYHAIGNLRLAAEILLEKTPRGIDIAALVTQLTDLEGIEDVHHIHLWTLDGQQHCATMHIVTGGDPGCAKAAVRTVLAGHNIAHAVLEVEVPGEACPAPQHPMELPHRGHHHHHHH